MHPVADSLLADLARTLADCDPAEGPTQTLQRLIATGLDQLPMPGAGSTLARWRALALVASHDLSLAKLYEGHTDALAILAELGAVDVAPPGSSWGVWAAEAPQGRAVIAARGSGGDVQLSGGKCWCSGAVGASHALLTAWWPDGRGPQLVAVEIAQPGIRVDANAWQAVGMAGSASLDVSFDDARARLIGQPGDYLTRTGFWHGGAGIAACWYGGALAIARTLHASLARSDPVQRADHKLAALGRIDVSLSATAALLHTGARWIDEHPRQDAHQQALRLRLAAEDAATLVLAEAGRALGAAPFCRDRRFAQMAADLPVFIRQSHAERDLQALGRLAIDATPESPWTL